MFDFLQYQSSVLGMNARNLEFIRIYNKRGARRIADDKILSKKLLNKAGVPTPKLITLINSFEKLESFDWTSLPESFALKPSRGFGGSGILVVYARKKNRDDAWIKADGSLITINDIKGHIHNILEGSFSLSNSPDVAFFEERIRLNKTFKPYTFRGIPDIRIIVFNKVPVMAMLRLPTKESGGKANLQLGGIGIGIDMALGVTTTAVWGERTRTIDYLPDKKLALSGIKIPYWNDILKLAVQAQISSKLGYLGADVAIDRERGPIFLELNARPGLQIQVANQTGLKERLERVKGLKIKTVERGVRVGKNLFGGEIEEELEEISGRRVIGNVEKVKLIGKNNKEIEVEAKIDTGADSTSIDTQLAKDLGFADVITYFEENIPIPESKDRTKLKPLSETYDKKYKDTHPDLKGVTFVYSSNGLTIRPKIFIDFVMDSTQVTSKATVTNRSNLKYPIIIGRKNLGRFLVDVNKINS